MFSLGLNYVIEKKISVEGLLVAIRKHDTMHIMFLHCICFDCLGSKVLKRSFLANAFYNDMVTDKSEGEWRLSMKISSLTTYSMHSPRCNSVMVLE